MNLEMVGIENEKKPMVTSLYDIELNNLMGEKINLTDYKDKHILFVNVASECGFTSQYRGLQKLHTKYKDKLEVIGIPCNQFGNQEPGGPQEIQSFCQKNYGVEFLITEKLIVKGDEKHPLYQWLTLEKMNQVKSSNVKWNFQKYLVGPNGNYIDYFSCLTKPNSSKIIKHLK